MIRKKCARCYCKFFEKSHVYSKRTRNIFKSLPPLCNDCRRILKIFSPSKLQKEKEENETQAIQEKYPEYIRDRVIPIETFFERKVLSRDLFIEAKKFYDEGFGSISFMQRKFHLTFEGAKQILEMVENLQT